MVSMELENMTLRRSEDVKAFYGSSSTWLDKELNGEKFLFCEKTLPSYGASRILVHGWVFRPRGNHWERFFQIHLNSVGEVKLAVDPATGSFNVIGTANNRFLDKKIFTFDLNATTI